MSEINKYRQKLILDPFSLKLDMYPPKSLFYVCQIDLKVPIL